MWRKRHKPEEIVAKLLQVNVLVTQGQGVADERNPVASRSRARRLRQLYRWAHG